MDVLISFGHGTASAEQLLALLEGADVRAVVDVRRHPGSRRNPHVARDRLASWLGEAGIDYRWEERLGGRRRGTAGSPHTGLRNASFRAYADHLATREFLDAFVGMRAQLRRGRTAMMCSESLWWRCHRRLIADHAVLVAGVEVRHLHHDGRLHPHVPTDVARLEDGRVLYDGGQPHLQGR